MSEEIKGYIFRSFEERELFDLYIGLLISNQNYLTSDTKTLRGLVYKFIEARRADNHIVEPSK